MNGSYYRRVDNVGKAFTYQFMFWTFGFYRVSENFEY